jgi:hypothetical protein
MMRKAETQKSLAELGCDNPDCTHDDHSVLYPQQYCHPNEGLEAKYTKANGILTLSCFICQKLVCNIRVAERWDN